jgi:N-acetylmuramoyl-L-alanine amidase
MNRAVQRCLFLVVLLLAPALAFAQPVTVQNLRLYRAPDNTRLVFDLSGSLEHRLFTLKNPDRIVIDIDNARLQGTLPNVDPGEPVLGGIRAGIPEPGTLRIVLDLKVPTQPRSFVLKPAGPYGHRLVVDLYDAKILEEEQRKDAEAAREAATPSPTPAPAKREMVIAIDAGHGGDDPGAIGRRYHTREKDVTLAIARELARLVSDTPGMKAVLTRNGDYYVGLRDRFRVALRSKPDVFISIHADAMPGHKLAWGSSVYSLAQRGASDSISQRLADQENGADFIGGVYLSDKDSDVQRVLVDLSQDKSIEYSLVLAKDILAELRHVGPTHMNHVGQAGFRVLKSPDFPSVLVETAFISNPTEERKLRSPAFQHQLAEAILAGAKRYLAHAARPAPVAPAVQPVVAHGDPNGAREHIVQPGETLSGIAQHYNVHVDALRFFNSLGETDPPAGTHLRIPPPERES